MLQTDDALVASDLSEVLLSLQKLLLASARVGQQLVPALDQGGVTSFDGFRLDVLGGQQLVLERRDVGDALLLEGLQTGIKGLLQTHRKRGGQRGAPGRGTRTLLQEMSTCLVSSVWTEDRSLP